MENYMNLLQSKKMTLIMSLPENNPALCQAAFEYGADVVKVHANVSHRASQNTFKSVAEEPFEEMLKTANGPMGIVLGGDTQSAAQDMENAEKLGFQFVSLYAHHMPLCVLQNPNIYKMAACDYSYNMDEIRGFKAVGIDILEASIVHPEEYGQPLNTRNVIAYQRLQQESGLPVVVPTQKHILPSEVAKLYECGVKGLMIGAIVTGKDIQSIKRTVCDFKEAILKL